MYRFVYAFPDGRVYNRAVGGKDLQESFETFVRVHWQPNDPPGTLAVFQNHAVVARVLVGRDNESGDPVPYLKEIDPPRQHSLACGD